MTARSSYKEPVSKHSLARSLPPAWCMNYLMHEFRTPLRQPADHLFHAHSLAPLPEELEEPVLADDEAERLGAVSEVLVHGVLGDVEEVARTERPASRLLRDARLVALADLGGDVPVQAGAASGEHVDDLVGHVPVLRRARARRDLLLVEVDAVRAQVRARG